MIITFIFSKEKILCKICFKDEYKLFNHFGFSVLLSLSIEVGCIL